MPAPSNDNFANAIAISTSLPQTITGLTSVDTTAESGEPDPYFGIGGGGEESHAVWFSFTPTHTAQYRISIYNIAYATGSQPKASILGLYTGSAVNALTPISTNFGNSSIDSLAIRTTLTSGVTYYIQSGHPHFTGESANDHSITFDLKVEEITSPGIPPANDDIADAQDLGLDPSGTTSGSNIDATAESWEIADGYDQPSVWYKFNIDFTGTQTVVLTKTGTDPDWQPYAEIYSVINDPPGDFTDLSFFDYIGNTTQTATTATVDTNFVPGDYYLVVYNWNWDGSWDDFDLTFQPYSVPPANDNFNSREVIQSSYAAAVTGTTAGATTDSSEPNTNPGNINPPYPSVWYEWTAPNYNNSPLNFQIDTLGSSADTYLEVFTGTSFFEPLTLVASDHNSGAGGKSQLTLNAVGNTVYKIRVSSPAASEGTFNLNITAQVGGTPPANDDFANAELLTGYTDSASGTTVGATAEVGEQTWDGFFEQGEGSTTNSVWYKWVPPQTGRVRIGLTANSGLSLYLARGSSLTSLQEVWYFAVGSVGSGTENYDYITVEGGVDYYFIIQGNGGKEDTFSFNFYMENVAIPSNDDPSTPTVLSAINGTFNITQDTRGIYFDTVVTSATDVGDFITNANEGGTLWYKLTPDRYGSLTVHVNNDVVYNNDSTWDAVVSIWKGDSLTDLINVGAGVHEVNLGSTAVLEPGKTYWILVESFYWSTTLDWDYTIQLQDSRTDGVAPDPNNGTTDFDSTTGSFVADSIDGVFVASGGVGYGTITFPDGHAGSPGGWWTRFEVDSTSGDYLYRYGQTQQFIEIFRATREDNTYESVCILGHRSGNQTIAYYQNGTLRYDTGHAVWGANKYGSSDKVRIEVGANGFTIDGVNFFWNTTEGFRDTIDNQFNQFDYGIITYPGDGTSYVALDPEWNVRLSDIRIHDNPEISVMGPADENNKEVTSFYGYTTGDIIEHHTSDYQFFVSGALTTEGAPIVDVSAAEYSNGYSIIMDVTDPSKAKSAYYNVSHPTDSIYYDPYGDPASDTYYPGFSFRFYIHDNFPSTTALIAYNVGTDNEITQGWRLYVGNDGTLYIQPSGESALIPFCYVNINQWNYIEIQWDCHIRPYACKIWMGNSNLIGRFEETSIFRPTTMDPGPTYLSGYGVCANKVMKIEFRDIATTRCKHHRPLGPTTVIGKYLNGTGTHEYPTHVEGTDPTQTPLSFNGDFDGGTDGAGQPHYWTGWDRYDLGRPAGAMYLGYIFSHFPNSTVSLTTDTSGPPGYESANAMQVVAVDSGATVAYVFGGGTEPATDVIFPYEYADTISLHFWLKGIAGHSMHIEAESGIGGWVPQNHHTMSGDWEYVRLFLEPQNFSGFTHNLTALYVVFDSSVNGDTYLMKHAWFYLNADNNFFKFWQTSDNGDTVTEVPYNDTDSWQLIDEFPPTIQGDHIYAATDIFQDTVRGVEDDGKTHIPPKVFSSYLEYTFQNYNPPNNEKLFGAKLLTQSKDFSGPDNNRNVNWKSYGNAGNTLITIANSDGDYRAIGGRRAATHISDPDERRFGITLKRPPGLGEWTIDKFNEFRIRFGHHHDLFSSSSHIIGDYTNAGVLEGAYVELLVYDRALPNPNCIKPIDLSRVRFRTYGEGDIPTT